MKKTTFEVMGDRQKMLEGREASRRLMPFLPALVRLDGRKFHKFTRGLARPYDERLSRVMIETAKYLVDETHAAIGYTQSDEISLLFPNVNPDAQMMFDGRVQKLTSVFAAMATAKFNRLIAEAIPEKGHLLPVFDARVWDVSNLDLAAEHFIWREADATKNSLAMAAQSVYSHKELQKVGTAQLHEMLHAKGINWNNYPAFFKRGTYVRREAHLRQLTLSELSRIPEARRPRNAILRTSIVEMEMPPITKVANLQGVLCFGEAPQLTPGVSTSQLSGEAPALMPAT